MTVRKHLTRHDMKQDEVLSWLTRAIVWVEENSTKVLAGIGAVLGVALIAMGAISWSRSRSQSAYSMLAEVQRVAATPLATEAGPGAPSFATARERSQRTIDAADRMLADHGGGEAADWARYYRAVALLDLGQAEEAAQAAAELSGRADPATLLGGLSRMVAGQAEEARSNLQAAADHYAAAATYEGSGFPPELALLSEARCLEALGRTQEAVDAYQKVLDLFPDSPLASRATRMIQEIRGS